MANNGSQHLEVAHQGRYPKRSCRCLQNHRHLPTHEENEARKVTAKQELQVPDVTRFQNFLSDTIRYNRNSEIKGRLKVKCWLPFTSESLPCVSYQQNLKINLLKPPGHVMHQQFNIQQLYALPTLYLCVLYLSENKQRRVPLIS